MIEDNFAEQLQWLTESENSRYIGFRYATTASVDIRKKHNGLYNFGNLFFYDTYYEIIMIIYTMIVYNLNQFTFFYLP